MELKRILASNNRQANDKAVALYGPDVLVISSCQVRGQTELIVAVDIPAIEGEEALHEELGFSALSNPTAINLATLEPIEKKPFEEHLAQSLAQNATQDPIAKSTANSISSNNKAKRLATVTNSDMQAFEDKMLGHKKRASKSGAAEASTTSATSASSATETSPQVKASQHAEPAQDNASTTGQATQPGVVDSEHDKLRGQEIVAMVRDELAALRKEFRMSQQMNLWQLSAQVHPALAALRQSLQEAPIPAALKALLLDSIHNQDNPESALNEIKGQLLHSIGDVQRDLPDAGVHVITGLSGSGKTLSVARLAQHASTKHGCDQVAIVSYLDTKPGAWNQTQLLSAQSGVDCFRATNAAGLQLLLEELSSRRLILIDTSGVQMAERLEEVQRCCKEANLDLYTHAVVCADASSASIARLNQVTGANWTSWVVSKMDESTQPWALLQFLIEQPTGVSLVSRGERMGDWSSKVNAQEWVEQALSLLNLSPAAEKEHNLHAAMSRASAKIAQLTQDGVLQMTGTHS
jgi:flagellar biosynthesis GTPase FlhF